MSLKLIILIQGIYYFLTALWPLVHVKSFKFVTGYNKKDWQLDTISLMILSSSLVFLYAGLSEKEISPEVLILSLSNILALTFVDIYFSLKKILRKIYLLDAGIEVLILIVLGVTYVEAGSGMV